MKILLILFATTFLFAKTQVELKQEFSARAEKEKWTFTYDEKVLGENPVFNATQAGQYRTGFKKIMGKFKKGFTYDSLKDMDVPLPAEWDWRTQATLLPVRNQGNCGSCWAFSTIAATYDALAIKGKFPATGPLSEQYLVDCATDMYGCDGGMPEAFNWVKAPKGAPLNSDYPYTAQDGSCKMAGKVIAGQIQEWHYIGESDRLPTIDEMKKAIYTYGPISVTVCANGPFVSYTSGIYNACSQCTTNHMTDLVGWSDAGKYWIMRNSWGSSWGENGYMRIKWTGSNGQLCNRLGEDSVYVKVDEKIVPPTPKEFEMSVTDVITIKVKMNVNAKYTIEEAKKILQPIMDQE